MDLKNKKIIVMGLGLHGGGLEAIKWLVKQGAEVLVTDLKTRTELAESLKQLKNLPIKYVLGKHRTEDFKNIDIVIKNPAVPENSPYLKIAKKNKVLIETDISLFLQEIGLDRRVIGITGTKGKSTTTSLIGEILKQKYPEIIIAGNIRVSPLKFLSKKITPKTLIVLELSSWQLAGIKNLKYSPHIAVLTNIMPDHLNKYKSMKEYIADKEIIFKYQKPGDILIANKDNLKLKQVIKKARPRAKIIWFSKKDLKNYKLKIIGEHNIENAAAATAAAAIMKIPPTIIKKTIENFIGLDSRLQFVKESRGVKYYNDTTATTPEATIAALKSFPAQKIILIAGGADKNLDFNQLGQEVKKRVKKLILIKGTANSKIKRALKKAGYDKEIKEASLMIQAVKQAQKSSQKKDIILLSPACASFGLFKHEFDRGNQFVKAVRNAIIK